MDYSTLQELWWLICSIIGAFFIFLMFVQGGQTLLWQIAKTKNEKSLVINSLGRKWEITFTTLVVFGGSLFASFPKFYATSFGGAYWVWILILFTFVIQAVSFEYRTKPNNFLGATVYETFLFINGSIGILLIGAAVGTFFTGSNFTLSEFNFVTWQHSLRGLEAAFSPFNLCLGFFLVFNSRNLGAMYLINNIDFSETPDMQARLRKASLMNFIISLPFLLYVLVCLLMCDGFGVNNDGQIAMISNKYLSNFLANPILLICLLLGLVLVIFGVFKTAFTESCKGIWSAGAGTFLVGLTVLLLPAYNNTSFYPSKSDLQSSLTIYNASSSPYTLMVMTYVALCIPFVIGYIAYVWKAMDNKQLTVNDINNKEAY